MFTDLLNLPLNSGLPNGSAEQRATIQDQVLSIAGMTWTDYEQLTSCTFTDYKISYSNGTITIVSPSRNHERIAEIINGLIKTYCRKYNLAYFPMGSTTLKNPPFSGKEPDHSFAFKTDKPLPELAVEVNYTPCSVIDLEKYRDLGIKEVWMWKDEAITFYYLVDSQYQEVKNSVCLPKLSAEFLITFINRGLTETPLTIERGRCRWLVGISNRAVEEDFYQQLN